MSAIGNPQLKPVEAPPSQGTTSSTPPPERKRPWGALLLVPVIAAGGWLAYQKWGKPQPTAPVAAAAIRTARVTVGPLQQTIRLAGQTSAREFVNITAPILRLPDSGPMILLSLTGSGKHVKKGEVLATMDTKAADDHIDDVVDQVAQAQSDIGKRMAELKVDSEQLEQTIRVAKSEYDKAVLDAKISETRTEVERELLKLAVEEAEAAYKQSLADVPHYKASQASDVRMLEIAKLRDDRHLSRHESDVEKYTLVAPMDGLAVVQQTYRGGEWGMVQAGDQMLPGMLIMKVVRPDRMQVEATINQSDSDMFRIGQKCIVKLDAFPGLTLPGRIHSIGAMAVGTSRQQNYYVRSVPIMVAIDGADSRLIPDMSASADVILAEEASTKQIPLAALHKDKETEFVFVRRNGRFERREVKTGIRNQTHVAVVSGLEENDEVALERPQGS